MKRASAAATIASAVCFLLTVACGDQTPERPAVEDARLILEFAELADQLGVPDDDEIHEYSPEDYLEVVRMYLKLDVMEILDPPFWDQNSPEHTLPRNTECYYAVAEKLSGQTDLVNDRRENAPTVREKKRAESVSNVLAYESMRQVTLYNKSPTEFRLRYCPDTRNTPGPIPPTEGARTLRPPGSEAFDPIGSGFRPHDGSPAAPGVVASGSL